MIECGLLLPQVVPQVKGVFGRKSLDDVIPGSWYIIPFPSVTTRNMYNTDLTFHWPRKDCTVSGCVKFRS